MNTSIEMLLKYKIHRPASPLSLDCKCGLTAEEHKVVQLNLKHKDFSLNRNWQALAADDPYYLSKGMLQFLCLSAILIIFIICLDLQGLPWVHFAAQLSFSKKIQIYVTFKSK